MQLIEKIKTFWSHDAPTNVPRHPLTRRARAIPWAERYFVSSAVIDATHEHLRSEGVNPREGLVYWAGWFEESSCTVSSTIMPRGISRWGGVRVPTEEMIRIAGLLRSCDLLIVAQVHTHPGDHGHSAGDDVNAVSSIPGFLSIVVPEFDQFDRLPLERLYFHRYLGNGRWQELTAGMKLIHIDPVRIG